MRISSYLVAAALCLPPVYGHRKNSPNLGNDKFAVRSGETANANSHPLGRRATGTAKLIRASLGDLTVSLNTSSPNGNTATAGSVTGETIQSTALVIARDATVAYSAYSGLNAYAIPYSVLIVPSTGAALPSLNDSATVGNYGLIVVLSEVSYDYGGSDGYQSALTTTQWTTLYNYQISFGVRMVRLDVYPSAATGTSSIGGCCATGVEQLISISNESAFPTAGLRVGATLSTVGLWHYPSVITNHSIATEFAQFAPTTGFSNTTTAAVINNIGGRQQMVFFLPAATDWSVTSNFLQHAWIHWATRGLYTGYRRSTLCTQVDDMFLVTDLYSPTGTSYRIGTADLAVHIPFMTTINGKLNPGSHWWMEIGHNGNGNIEMSDDLDDTGVLCSPGPIEYPDQIDTPLEFRKPAGSGTNLWPNNATSYPGYSQACLENDDLLVWWQVAANRDAFSHISHTFTHEDQDNSTYFDVTKELSWNQAWLDATGLSSALMFSSGLIPPAITGLHNADALRAWSDLNIYFVVGDNTRPVLLNTVNEHWPLMSTVALNGYAGIQITPRWASNIYYNCDVPACTVLEWINTSNGSGDFNSLLTVEKNTNVRHMLGLRHDPYMFHQANLRYTGVPLTTVNGVKTRRSLFQAWIETVTAEFVRLVNWPIYSLIHDDIAGTFASRMNRDACKPNLSWKLDPTKRTITDVTVTCNNNQCSELLPVTFPGSVTDNQGAAGEQVGLDPLTLWVTLNGSPIHFTLSTPIPV